MEIDIAIDKRKQTALAIRKKLERSNAGLYIWGCKLTAKVVMDYLKKSIDIIPDGFIVDDNYYSSQEYLSLPVIKRSEWEKSHHAGDQIVIGFTNETIAERLIKQLPNDTNGYYFYFPYSSGAEGRSLDTAFFEAHKKDYENAYDSLADEESRIVMQDFIGACITGDVSKLNQHISEGQYFNDLTKEKCRGDFIDIGAYIGDTAIEALDFYGNDIKKVISFEPDSNNTQKYMANLSEHKNYSGRFTLISKGTWSKKDTLYFSSSDSSSSISNSGDISIEVDSVDNVLKEFPNEDSIGYIKMDVEGSEKETLIGCKNTIEKYHPTLAVCVYHKPEDIFDLFSIIESYDKYKQYKYYLRYYGPDLRELVLYAI